MSEVNAKYVTDQSKTFHWSKQKMSQVKAKEKLQLEFGYRSKQNKNCNFNLATDQNKIKTVPGNLNLDTNQHKILL
jgi:hypothetical protein